MAEFLSGEWMDEMTDAANAATVAAAEDTRFCVEQVVPDAPHGEVCYHIVLADARVHFVAGAASDPDLVLVAEYDVAAALSRGEANAQDALAQGRLKVRGNLHAVVDHERLLAELDDVFAPVRDATTYAGPAGGAGTMPP